MVMDLLEGGELLDRIRTKARFTEAEASVIMRTLVQAIDFLHSNGIIHRDLKPEVLSLLPPLPPLLIRQHHSVLISLSPL